MKRSDELFNLIHRMNSAEKRYFKRFSSIHSDKKDNISIRIFDSVEKSQEADTEKWESDFKDEKVKSHLHVSRNYLLKHVLKSLRNFHSGYCQEAELKELIAEIEILSQKKLYQHAARLSFKVLKEAEKSELFLPWAEALNWVQKIKLYAPHVDMPLTPLGKTMIVAQAYAIETELEWINNQWIAGYTPQNQQVHNEEVIAQFISLQALQSFAYAFAYYHQNQFEESVQFFEKGFALFQQNKALIEEKPARYFLNIQAFVNLLISLRQFEYALKVMEDAYELFSKLQSQRIVLLSQDFQLGYFLAKLKILNLTYHFSEIEKTIQQIDLFTSKNEIPMYLLQDIALQKAIFLSNQNQHSLAKNIVQNILSIDPDLISVELKLAATIFNLMLTFAINQSDYETLKIRVFNIKRWMGQKNLLNDRLSELVEILAQKASYTNVDIPEHMKYIPELPGLCFTNWVHEFIKA